MILETAGMIVFFLTEASMQRYFLLFTTPSAAERKVRRDQ